MWIVDRRLWIVDRGLWIMDYGLWIMDYGLWMVKVYPIGYYADQRLMTISN